MKTTRSGLIFVLLAVSGMALLVGNAKAEISMSERENVQTIVRVVEFVTFVAAMAIAWYVWRISKRAIKNKKSKQVKP
jgi:protein-S-isoprenylcysteine O-methyltransferase Ste14